MQTSLPRPLPRGLLPALITLAVLAIPLVAMQYTTEVQWDPPDFVIMGTLLFATGLGLEWAIRHRSSLALRTAWAMALLSTFLMTWVNMAVGLLGGESNPVNMLLLTVPVLGIVGAVLARLQPRGMVLVMVAMAALHLGLAVVGFVQGWQPSQMSPVVVWAPNGFFITLHLAAALMFWSATAPVNRMLQGAVVALLGLGIGAGGVTVGAVDDAPGVGVIGLVLMLGMVVLGVRLARSQRD